MSRFIITGGSPLVGRVRISGAKNAALTAICASLLAKGDVTLDNIPRISDVEVLIKIINNLGVKTYWD